MKVQSLLLLFSFLFGYVFSYYSIQLNKINLVTSSNYSNNNFDIQINATQEQMKEFEEYIDLPLNNSELNKFNESFIKTKNIKSEIYTMDLYSTSHKKYFRLLLSTFDNITTIASINCQLCNVINKYDPSLSNNNNLLVNGNNLNTNPNYKILTDSFILLSETIQAEINIRKNLTIDNLLFKVINTNISGFPNSSLIDGILSLNYNNDTNIPNNNLIMELYNEKKISSPSFTIIITSSNINRLYLGDIMKNKYVKNYMNSSMNKGECSIINNNWQCQIDYLEYSEYSAEAYGERSHSLIKFDLKENILTIPSLYYDLLITGCKKVRRKKSFTYETICSRKCYDEGGEIYCTCSRRNSFGVITFLFKNRSKLDVDLNDYVYYDENAFSHKKCRVDISLSTNNEFIIGLRGLNNTILSFDIDDKKIEFFHKKKTKPLSILIWIIFFFILAYMGYDSLKK